MACFCAEFTGLGIRQCQRVIDALFAVACDELKKNGKCNFINMVRIQLKPAVAARQGINPFTKQQCMLKAKPRRVTCFALRKLKRCLADELGCHWLR